MTWVIAIGCAWAGLVVGIGIAGLCYAAAQDCPGYLD
jgi:hypothetical protein